MNPLPIVLDPPYGAHLLLHSHNIVIILPANPRFDDKIILLPVILDNEPLLETFLLQMIW